MSLYPDWKDLEHLNNLYVYEEGVESYLAICELCVFAAEETEA